MDINTAVSALTSPSFKGQRRVVVYARVAHGVPGGVADMDLEIQRHEMEELAQRRGWEIVGRFDEVASGMRAIARPALADALKMLDDDEADLLIVHSLDRLTRSVAELSDLIDRAEARGKSIVTVDGTVDMENMVHRQVMRASAAVLRSLRG